MTGLDAEIGVATELDCTGGEDGLACLVEGQAETAPSGVVGVVLSVGVDLSVVGVALAGISGFTATTVRMPGAPVAPGDPPDRSLVAR
jgi:hypothetical protein